MDRQPGRRFLHGASDQGLLQAGRPRLGVDDHVQHRRAVAGGGEHREPGERPALPGQHDAPVVPRLA